MKTMRKNTKAVLALCLAAAIALGGMAFVPRAVRAADTVTADHTEITVNKSKYEVIYLDKDAPEHTVYCLNHGWAYPKETAYEVATEDAAEIIKYIAHDRKELDVDKLEDGIKQVLYNGYPLNQGEKPDADTNVREWIRKTFPKEDADALFRVGTQYAVWALSHDPAFAELKEEESAPAKEVAQYLLEHGKEIPADKEIQVTVYRVPGQSDDLSGEATPDKVYQNLIRGEIKTKAKLLQNGITPQAAPSIASTTLTANGSAATADAVKVIEVEAGGTVTLSDEVVLENLEKDKTYELEWELLEIGNMGSAVAGDTIQGISTSPVTINIGALGTNTAVEQNPTKLTNGKTYTVVTSLKETGGGEPVATHNAEFDDKLESVEIKVTGLPTITSTTARVNGQMAAVVLAAGAQGTLTDEVSCENLEEGKTYKLISTAYKDKSKEPYGASVETENITSETEFPVTVPFDKKITEAGTYSICTELVQDETIVATHNEAFDVPSETVTVSYASISTSATAEGAVRDAKKGAKLDYKLIHNKKLDILDTVTYKGLLQGSQYTISGTLVQVDKDGKITNEKVATATVTFQAAAADGTETLVFEGVTLQPYAKYVVFEEVTDTATKTVVAAHKDVKDLAQTIVTSDENGVYAFDPQGEPEPEPEPEPDPGTMSTTVKANRRNGTAETPLQLTNGSGQAGVQITDVIAYGNLTPGATYEVTTTLLRISGTANAPDVTAVGNPLVTEQTASESGEGEWEITFPGKHRLRANTSYVIYETAVNKEDDTDKAEHTEVSDKSQMIVIGQGLVPASGTSASIDGSGSPKTGDANNVAFWLALLSAAGYAMILLFQRRRA